MNIVKIRLVQVFLSCLLILLVACNNKEESSAPTVTNVQSSASVEITHPETGATIYSETIYIAGKLTSQTQPFQLEIVNIEDEVITQTTVNTEPGEWQVEVVHDYIGDPAEIIIRAVPLFETTVNEYDSVVVFIADNSHRPDGAFGTIMMPENNTTAGGDSILVRGVASGIFENMLTIELRTADNRILDTRTITMFNPHFIDSIPWETEIATNNHTGLAIIRAVSVSADDGTTITLDEVRLALTQAAG